MVPLLSLVWLAGLITWSCAMHAAMDLSSSRTPPTVIDVQIEGIANDMMMLLSAGPGSMQHWVPRMELCSREAVGQGIVRDALEWYNGVTPDPQTCCVNIEEHKCASVNEVTATVLETPHLVVRDEKDAKLFIGVHRPHWACPEGYEPLIVPGNPLEQPQDTCCSFYDADATDKENAAPHECGAKYCSNTPHLVETAFCDRMPPMPSDYTEKGLAAYAGGPMTTEDKEDGATCQLDKVKLESGDEVDAESVDDESVFQDACEQQDKDVAEKNCAFCITKMGGSKVMKCTECSRVERAMNNGWDCESFGPSYPCAGHPSAYGPNNMRSYEKDTDFAAHRNLAFAGSAAEHIINYDDGLYRQGGPPSTTSPLRWRAGGAQPMFGHKETDTLHHLPRGQRGEAAGTCGSAENGVSKLRLERNSDEPLQASAEDFASDDERLEQVLRGLGSQLGLQSVRSVLFPRVSAEADFSDPGDVAFLDAASHYFACSDSRSTYGILGTPGGDLAEFLLAMNVMERARQPHHDLLSDESVMYHFQEYLEHMVKGGKKHFFYCIGSDALQRWADVAQVADPLRPRGGQEISRLTQYGLFPEHIGSAHIRAMLQDPAGYRCRRALVFAVVRAFLTVYYDVTHPSRGRLIMAVHEGNYAKEAVLYVDRAQGYPCGDMAPRVVPVTPALDQLELFVVHRAAVDIYRERLARFVVEKLELPLRAEANIYSNMRDIGSIQLTATLRALLPDATEYIANFV